MTSIWILPEVFAVSVGVGMLTSYWFRTRKLSDAHRDQTRTRHGWF